MFLHSKTYSKVCLKDALYQRPPWRLLKIEDCSPGGEDTEFRSLTDALLYLARGSRPDIAFTVNF